MINDKNRLPDIKFNNYLRIIFMRPALLLITFIIYPLSFILYHLSFTPACAGQDISAPLPRTCQ